MSTEEPEPELAAGAGDGAFSLSTAVAGGAATDVVVGLGVRSETTHNNKHLSSNVRCWLSNNWKIIIDTSKTIFLNFNSYIFGGENKLLIRFAKEFIRVYKYFKQNEDSLIMIISVSTKNNPIS